MDSLRPNTPAQINISVAATQGTGGAQAQAGSAALGAPALAPNTAQAFSQQMLMAYVQMAENWAGVLGMDPQLLAMPLSGNYQGLVPGSQGNAQDLPSLSTPLRNRYAYLFAGTGAARDDFQSLSSPLSMQYNALLNIPGMPPIAPLPGTRF